MARGYNKERAYFVFNTPLSIHAEADVLIKFRSKATRFDKQKVDLLVVRSDSNGNLGMSLPCLACVRLLAKYTQYINLNHIYYSNAKGEIIKTNLPELVKNPKVRMAPAYINH